MRKGQSWKKPELTKTELVSLDKLAEQVKNLPMNKKLINFWGQEQFTITPIIDENQLEVSGSKSFPAYRKKTMVSILATRENYLDALREVYRHHYAFDSGGATKVWTLEEWMNWKVPEELLARFSMSFKEVDLNYGE